MGIVYQQLLVNPGISYTPHDSFACVVVDYHDPAFTNVLLKFAIDHIHHEKAAGKAWKKNETLKKQEE